LLVVPSPRSQLQDVIEPCPGVDRSLNWILAGVQARVRFELKLGTGKREHGNIIRFANGIRPAGIPGDQGNGISSGAL